MGIFVMGSGWCSFNTMLTCGWYCWDAFTQISFYVMAGLTAKKKCSWPRWLEKNSKIYWDRGRRCNYRNIFVYHVGLFVNGGLQFDHFHTENYEDKQSPRILRSRTKSKYLEAFQQVSFCPLGTGHIRSLFTYCTVEGCLSSIRWFIPQLHLSFGRNYVCPRRPPPNDSFMKPYFWNHRMGILQKIEGWDETVFNILQPRICFFHPMKSPSFSVLLRQGAQWPEAARSSSTANQSPWTSRQYHTMIRV